MKRCLMTIAVCFAACVAHAGVVTNFYADFESSADGSATAANLNAGTAIGAWSVQGLEESFVNSGTVAWDLGQYTNDARLATAATRANGVVFSYDILSKRAAAVLGGKASAIRVLDENGNTIINLSYSATATESRLQVWDEANTSWLFVSSDLAPAHASETAPEAMVHVDVAMDADGFTVAVDDEVLTDKLIYNNTSGSLVSELRFYGVHSELSGAWYDNIQVLQSTEDYDTLFFADFNGSTNGSASADNLNAGTSVGSWSVLALEESFVDSGTVAWDLGQYTNDAHLAMAVSRSERITFSYDILSKRAAASLGGKASAVRVLDENGNTIVNLSYSATATESRLQVWDHANTEWLFLSSDLPPAHTPATAPETMVHVEVKMSDAGFTVAVDGEVLTGNLLYNTSTGSKIGSIRFYGVHTELSGAWYDNILVTRNLAPEGYAAYLHAGFYVADSGGAGTLTNAAQLDAGTEVGSWVLDDAQESLLENGAIGFDQGAYNATANLETNAAVEDGVVFDAFIRARRDGAVKWNGIRIKNESGQNALSLRWSGRTDGVSGSLEYWDGEWVFLSTNIFLPNDFGFTSGQTDHLQVIMRDADYDVLVNGATLLSGEAYQNAMDSVSAVQFFGDADQAGAWYDSVRVWKADAVAGIAPIGLVSMAALSANDVVLSWGADAAGTYVLQCSTNLLTGSWINLVENITGTDGTLSVTTTPVSAAAFYRIVGE